MYESKKRKSSSYRRSRNRIRSVTTSRWELPIPGSKSYWDEVCDDLEKRANRVSHSLSPNQSFLPNPTDEFDAAQKFPDNASNRSSFIVEPIVRISPPTPMRRADKSRDVIYSPKVFCAGEHERDNSYCVKKCHHNFLRIGHNFRNDPHVSEGEFDRSKIGRKINVEKNDLQINSESEFRSARKELEIGRENNLATRSTNELGLNPSENYSKKNFANFARDENLENELDIRGEKMAKISEYISEFLQRGKLATKKIRQRKNLIVQDEEKYLSVKSRPEIAKREKIHSKKSCPLLNRDASTIPFDVNAYSSVKEDSLEAKTESTKKGRSSTMLENNLNDILKIEKLNEAVVDDNFFKLNANSSPEMKMLAESLRNNESNEEPEKDFLGIPKLGTISSYPSFSKIVTVDSLDVDDDQKSFPRDIQSADHPSLRNDLLRVPKLGTVSSYPSFNSPVSESLDADDPSTLGSPTAKDYSTSSEASFPRHSPSTAETSLGETKDSSRIIRESRIETCSRDAEVKTSPGVHFVEAEKSKRRKSLKDSVRYAYKALKFLTPNKTLDFVPKSYRPSAKASSASNSSGSSGRSRRSKVEPAIKLLTYEDVAAGSRASKSSGTTYSTMKARLREKASRYMGPTYVFPNPKVVPRSSSTTMASLKRSTSGRTMDLEEPSLSKPSADEILERIPKMTIFPRRKCDKCFACLHRSFEQPVNSIRELPLSTLSHAVKTSIRSVSESGSSTVSLPDLKRFKAVISDSEASATDASKEEIHSKSLATFFSQRTSEDSVSPKSDGHQNLLSPNDLKTGLSISKPWSLSTDRSSSDSEDPQLQMDQNNASSKYFVPCHAPLVWCQNLAPLKALRFKKPVSLQSRFASTSKSEGDSDTDDSVEELRSARSDTKSKTAPVQQEDTDRVADEQIAAGQNDQKIERQQSVVGGLVKKVSTINLLASLQEPVKSSAAEKQLVELQQKSEKMTARVASTEVQDHIRTEILQGIPEDSGMCEVMDGSSTASQQSVEKSQITSLKTRIIGRASVLTSLTASEKVGEREKDESEEKYVVEAEEERKGDELSPQDDDALAGALEDRGDAILSAGESVSVDHQSRGKRSKSVKTLLRERTIDVLRKCIAEDLQPMEILEIVGAEVARGDPFAWTDPTDPEVARSARVAHNLMRLLIQSKKYLDPDTFSPNLEFSSPQIPFRNSRQLRRILPVETYDLIAPIMGIPRHSEKGQEDSQRSSSPGRRSRGRLLPGSFSRKESDDSDDLIVHPPSARNGMEFADFNGALDEPQKSPYALFMEKPRRKVVTWRPLTERDLADYDPEATLKMRATKITDKICKDFCDWYRSLGGDDGNINEDVLKDMFEIDFTVEACKTMQFLVKEMPMVPTPVALCRNSPERGELALTRKLLIRDAKAERRAKRTTGFGTHLSIDDRFIPPKNQVREKWLRCENVPRDLETMAAVWEGITGLDSVKGFLEWMKDHPEIKPPKILAQARLPTKETLARHSSMNERLEDASRGELETNPAKKFVGEASDVTTKVQRLSTKNEYP